MEHTFDYTITLFSPLAKPISKPCLLRLLLTSRSLLLLRLMEPPVSLHGISLPVFPRLPAWFTPAGYDCLFDFDVYSQLIRRKRLNIRFLFVRLRFRYPFFSPTPRDVNLGSRFGVRRQLRPLWTFTTGWRHAHHTIKALAHRGRCFYWIVRFPCRSTIRLPFPDFSNLYYIPYIDVRNKSFFRF